MSHNSEDSETERPEFSLSEIKYLERVVISSYIRDDEASDDDWDKEQYGEMLGKLTLGRLRIEIKQHLDNAERDVIKEHESNDIDDNLLNEYINVKKTQSTSHIVIEYFTLVSILIESLSIKLLKKELIDENYSNANKTETMLQNRMDQKMRENLLFRTGIIKESTKSEMSHIRGVRNRFVHNPAEHMFLDGIDNIASELDRAYNIHLELMNQTSEDDIISLDINLEDE